MISIALSVLRLPILNQSSCALTPSSFSFNHLISAGEKRRWDRQVEGFGGSHVNDEIELSGLLYRKVGGVRTLQNLVNVARCATILVWPIGAIRHQATV